MSDWLIIRLEGEDETRVYVKGILIGYVGRWMAGDVHYRHDTWPLDRNVTTDLEFDEAVEALVKVNEDIEIENKGI